MWYVVHTMAGLEQKCMQQCQHIVQYSEGLLIGDEVLVTSEPIKKCKG